jgi:formyl-CoA transferase
MVSDLGEHRTLDTPIKLSRTPGGARTPPPKFAEHSHAVLAAHGYGADEIAALEADGVVFAAKRG